MNVSIQHVVVSDTIDCQLCILNPLMNAPCTRLKKRRSLFLSFTHWERFPQPECLCAECSTPWVLWSNGVREGACGFSSCFQLYKHDVLLHSFQRLGSSPLKYQGYSNRVAGALKIKPGRPDAVHLNTKHIDSVYFFCPNLGSRINSSVADFQGFRKREA